MTTYKPCVVMVQTVNAETDEFKWWKTVDLHNSAHRKWLTNHLTWCAHNNHGAVIRPEPEMRYNLSGNGDFYAEAAEASI